MRVIMILGKLAYSREAIPGGAAIVQVDAGE
jgi:hypothetical protein